MPPLHRIVSGLNSKAIEYLLALSVVFVLAVAAFFYTFIYHTREYLQSSPDRPHLLLLKYRRVFVGDGLYYLYCAHFVVLFLLVALFFLRVLAKRFR